MVRPRKRRTRESNSSRLTPSDQNTVNISARVKIQLLSKESEDPGKGLRLLAQLIEKLRGNIGHLDARARHHLDGPQAPGVMQDRKSTRLNSSHGYISYAVFCLKK